MDAIPTPKRWGGKRPGAGRPRPNRPPKPARTTPVRVRIATLKPLSARLGLPDGQAAALGLQALDASLKGAWARIRLATTNTTLRTVCAATGAWKALKPHQKPDWTLLGHLDRYSITSQVLAAAAHALRKRLHPTDILLLQLWAQRWAAAPDTTTAAAIWGELANDGPPLVPEGGSAPTGPVPAPAWPPSPSGI